jgi:hypothetical protein
MNARLTAAKNPRQLTWIWTSGTIALWRPTSKAFHPSPTHSLGSGLITKRSVRESTLWVRSLGRSEAASASRRQATGTIGSRGPATVDGRITPTGSKKHDRKFP